MTCETCAHIQEMVRDNGFESVGAALVGIDRLRREFSDRCEKLKTCARERNVAVRCVEAMKPEMQRLRERLALITADRDCWFNKDKVRHQQVEELRATVARLEAIVDHQKNALEQARYVG